MASFRYPADAKAELEKAFGPIENLTGAQVWALVKLCKNVRLRCRNNAAFNNYFNGIFNNTFRFREVTKQRQKRYAAPGVMESYPGLQISNSKGEPVSSAAEEDDEG